MSGVDWVAFQRGVAFDHQFDFVGGKSMAGGLGTRPVGKFNGGDGFVVRGRKACNPDRATGVEMGVGDVDLHGMGHGNVLPNALREERRLSGAARRHSVAL